MNTNLDEFTEAQVKGECDRPDISGRLYDFIDDPLGYPEAREVESHLLECLECREFFLAMMSIRTEACRTKGERGDEDLYVSDEAQVIRIGDFRKDPA